MIHQKEEETKGENSVPLAVEGCKNNRSSHGEDREKRAQRTEKGCRNLKRMGDAQSTRKGIENQREIKEDDPWLREKPLHQSKRPFIIIIQEGQKTSPPVVHVQKAQSQENRECHEDTDPVPFDPGTYVPLNKKALNQ